MVKKRVAPVKKKKSKPQKKYSKKDLCLFKKIILKRKEEVIDDIKHISADALNKSQKESSGDFSGYTYHMADVATDTYDREFSLGRASNEREMLYELDDALKKIDEGTYGICEECHGHISKTRLKALAYTRMCIKCQQKTEKT